MMKASIPKLLMMVTVAGGISAIASVPVSATTLRPSNIEFSTYNGLPQIETYLFSNPPTSEIVNGVSRQVLDDVTNDNVGKAIQALTDDSAATNVELWYGNESPQRVGFTANLGSNTIKVENVTKADWADGVLATAWLNGLRDRYSSLMSSIGTTGGSNLLNDLNTNFDSLVTYLRTNGYDTAGDPNVGSVTYNDQTGQLQVDLVGHLDVSGRYVDTRRKIMQGNTLIDNPNFGIGLSPDFNRNRTGNQLLDSALFAVSQKAFQTNQYLQFSEIAKVTFNGEVNYAYAFTATDSGAIAGTRNVINDSTSHTGIYSWTKNNPTNPNPPATVPEPSTILGLVAVGGLFAARRKTSQKA
jgi:PEP-CTERM motif